MRTYNLASESKGIGNKNSTSFFERSDVRNVHYKSREKTEKNQMEI